VNKKLRGQKLKVEEDPPFQAVKELYTERLHQGCSRTTFEGWEFLFSVAEAHPLSRQGRTSVPIQGHPDGVLSDLEKNKWNLLTPDERMVYYNRFWELLPAVLPFKEWSAIWRSGVPETRKGLLKHLWGIRCEMEAKLELLNSTSYNSLCKELKSYRSGCATSVRGKTCRKKRAN